MPRRSKRSARVGLSRMVAPLGLLAGGAALLAGCGSEPSAPPPAAPQDNSPKTAVQAFENVFECAGNSDLGKEGCAKAHTAAVAAAEKTAPRFAGQGDCENDWGPGACVSQTKGGLHYFAPFVGGFIVGKLIEGRREFLPVFHKSGEAGLFTANGARLGYDGAPGKYFASARALERQVGIPTIKSDSGALARGGIGVRGQSDDSETELAVSSSRRRSYGSSRRSSMSFGSAGG